MQSAISTAAEIQIRPVGRPPPGSGTQSSVPAIWPCAPPTVIGTFQSKMWARASSSVTCGGLDWLIQCMRWSCHSNRPLRLSCFQRGVSARP